MGDYVGESGGSRNYSSQFKNLEVLVKSLEAQVLSKLDGSSKAGSSSNKATRLNLGLSYSYKALC